MLKALALVTCMYSMLIFIRFSWSCTMVILYDQELIRLACVRVSNDSCIVMRWVECCVALGSVRKTRRGHIIQTQVVKADSLLIPLLCAVCCLLCRAGFILDMCTEEAEGLEAWTRARFQTWAPGTRLTEKTLSGHAPEAADHRQLLLLQHHRSAFRHSCGKQSTARPSEVTLLTELNY